VAKMSACLICQSDAQFQSGGSVYTYDCPRCGKYERPGSGSWDIVQKPRQQVPISSWIRHQNTMGIVPFITLETLRPVRNISIPNLRERANLLLIALVKRYPRLADQHELNDLFAVLQDHDGYVELRTSGPPNALTVKGLLAADQLRTINTESAQCFVAMSFERGLTTAWTNGFDPAIRAAGYIPLRIDTTEFVGGISDQIIAEIRRSRFVVADYTQQRNRVYFEAGFALGLGLVVIPTCRDDEIDKLHFDIRHLNTLTWARPEDLAMKLSQRIKAVIGAGPI
jgi:hypothetical protein